jgi:hypothetical protein
MVVNGRTEPFHTKTASLAIRVQGERPNALKQGYAPANWRDLLLDRHHRGKTGLSIPCMV